MEKINTYIFIGGLADGKKIRTAVNSYDKSKCMTHFNYIENPINNVSVSKLKSNKFTDNRCKEQSYTLRGYVYNDKKYTYYRVEGEKNDTNDISIIKKSQNL